MNAATERRPQLMENHSSIAYQAGRILAICQAIQDADERDINATFTDRYFTAASSCPLRVIPKIVDTTMKRLRKLLRSDPRLGRDLRYALVRTYASIDEQLPALLNLQGKADFQLGYFHQHACRMAGNDRDSTRYRTNDGTSVKSRGELHLSNLLLSHSIANDYEPKVEFTDASGQLKSIHPDFRVYQGDHQFLIEYLGLDGDEEYDKRWRWKLRRIEDDLGGRQWADVDTDGRLTAVTLLPIKPDQLASKDDDRKIIEIISKWQSMV